VEESEREVGVGVGQRSITVRRIEKQCEINLDRQEVVRVGGAAVLAVVHSLTLSFSRTPFSIL